MIPTFFSSYFGGSDCIILDGRIHNIKYGEENENVFNFRGTELGVFLGPLLEELEGNAYLQQPDSLNHLFDEAAEKEVRRTVKEQNLALGLSDPEKIKRTVAYQVMKHYSLKDVLKKNGENTEQKNSFLSIEDVLAARNEIITDICSGSLTEVFGSNPVVLLGGNVYTTEESSRRRAEHSQIFFRIGQLHFIVRQPRTESLDELLRIGNDLRESKLVKAIQSSQAVQDYIAQQQSIDYQILDELFALDEFYDPEKNIGFISNDNGFFVFAKMPSYILFERITCNYYEFPAARVGVKIDVTEGLVTAKTPVVIEPYKHPALSMIGEAYQSVCFGYFKDPIKNRSVTDQINKFLYEGARMLMVNYCSDGNAYKNLEVFHYAKDFHELLVPGHLVDEDRVTNREVCIHAGV